MSACTFSRKLIDRYYPGLRAPRTPCPIKEYSSLTGTGELRCGYCDSSFTVAEVEAAFAPRLERADSRMTDTLPPTGPTHDVAPMRTYTCASCAAELVCDATAAITECPYCGNQASWVCCQSLRLGSGGVPGSSRATHHLDHGGRSSGHCDRIRLGLHGELRRESVLAGD